MERCWILVGMMGVGKSAVGRALAVRSEREYLDTDFLLQHKLGRPVSQLFHIYGESAFRDHETALLRDLQPQLAVVATGGGIVVRPDNWVELRRLGRVMYLRATVEDIIGRLTESKKRRPLLEVENWQDRIVTLMAEREALYQQADLVMQLSGDEIEGAAERAYALFCEDKA